MKTTKTKKTPAKKRPVKDPAFVRRLVETGACSEALGWLRSGKFKTPRAAWAACEDADWMGWLLMRRTKMPSPINRGTLRRVVIAVQDTPRGLKEENRLRWRGAEFVAECGEPEHIRAVWPTPPAIGRPAK